MINGIRCNDTIGILLFFTLCITFHFFSDISPLSLTPCFRATPDRNSSRAFGQVNKDSHLGATHSRREEMSIMQLSLGVCVCFISFCISGIAGSSGVQIRTTCLDGVSSNVCCQEIRSCRRRFNEICTGEARGKQMAEEQRVSGTDSVRRAIKSMRFGDRAKAIGI